MRTRRSARRLALWATAALATAVAAPPAGALTLTVSLDASVVSVGADVFVDVGVSGLGDGVPPALRSYDLDLSFADARLAFLGIDFDDALGTPGVSAFVDSTLPGPGLVDFASVSLVPAAELVAGQPDGFRLARLRFRASAEGEAVFALPQALLGDIGGVPLPVDAIAGATLTIVPEAGTALLLALGLGALAARRRRG